MVRPATELLPEDGLAQPSLSSIRGVGEIGGMFDWRDGMALDNGPLDEDHRRQMALIRRFLSLGDAEENRRKAYAVLENLRDATLQHFAVEERLQAMIHYPHIAEHKAQHRRLAAMLNELIEQVEAKESAFAFSYVKTKADENLQYWFLEHLAKADLRLKLYLAKVPGLVKPPPAKMSGR